MNINELEAQILKDTQKLVELQSQNGQNTEVVYNDGGEEKYRTLKVNNEEEIKNLRLRILEMKKELETRKANKEAYYQNYNQSKEQKNEQAELDKMSEDMKKYKFDQVKQIYKNQSNFTKFINLVNGKKPNWKNIKKYTEEELSFLIELNSGHTAYQEERNNRKRSLYEKEFSATKIESKISDLNKTDFNKSLVDPSLLKSKMELEEINARHR